MRTEVPACCCAGKAVSHSEAHTLSMAPWCCPHAFAVLMPLVITTQPSFPMLHLTALSLVLILYVHIAMPARLSGCVCHWRRAFPDVKWSDNLYHPPSFSTETISMDKVHYCERFIELMIDLEVRLNLSTPWLKENEIVRCLNFPMFKSEIWCTQC